jgi:ATP-dependent helicase/nuclease subunit A
VKPESGELYQPGYEPLQAFRQVDPNRQLIVLKPSACFIPTLLSSEETREASAETVSDFIKKAVSENRFTIYQRNETVGNPLRYCDIAILFRSHHEMEVYEESLQARGIPFILEGGKQFYKRTEIREIISLLKAIDNPRDEVSVIAALKSPVFGFSDEDILSLRVGDIPLSYIDAKQENHHAYDVFCLLRSFMKKGTVFLSDIFSKSCLTGHM